MLQLAVESERIGRNPVRLVRKARRPAKGEVQPLAPATVELIRSGCARRDAVLVSVLALGPRWRHVGERTLNVYAPKTLSRRSVRLLAPLAEDLAEWRATRGRMDGDGLVFPGHNGGRRASGRTRVGRGRSRVDVSARAGEPGALGRSPARRRRPGCRRRRRTRCGIRSARCCCTRVGR